MNYLSFFVINNNIVLEKEEIFDRVWGVDSETTINAIEVYISGLRKELRKIGYDKKSKNGSWCWIHIWVGRVWNLIYPIDYTLYNTDEIPLLLNF